MTGQASTLSTSHQIYPRRYFEASPTWSVWNKITAHTVHSLRQEPGFEGQKIYFHLNHPIQFVSLTGLATQIELGGGAAASKFCFITLDDGSGRVINVKITRREREELEMIFPSNTTVDELNINIKLGLPTLTVDKAELAVGQCIRVRGTLDTFRGTRQIDLKRIKIIKTTDEEVKTWTETARWLRDDLSRPWTLTPAEVEALDAELETERKSKEDRKLRKRAWHARRAEKQSISDGKAALKQERLERVYNSGALPGTEIINEPWR